MATGVARRTRNASIENRLIDDAVAFASDRHDEDVHLAETLPLERIGPLWQDDRICTFENQRERLLPQAFPLARLALGGLHKGHLDRSLANRDGKGPVQMAGKAFVSARSHEIYLKLYNVFIHSMVDQASGFSKRLLRRDEAANA